MKIFNNFDTKLKETEYQEAIKTYGKEHVMLIQRCFYYWLFKGIIPIVFFVVVSIFLFYVVYKLMDDLFILSLIIIILWSITFLLFFYYIYRTFIHYKMDFSVITSEEIITFSQLGILNAEYKNLPISKLRSTSSYRKGFMGNIFGFGEIKFITDGSSEIISDGQKKYGAGKLTFTYVSKPNQVRKEIMELFNKWRYYREQEQKENNDENAQKPNMQTKAEQKIKNTKDIVNEGTDDDFQYYADDYEI